MAFSARPSSANEITQLVNQTAHGFSVGQIVVYNGSTYVLSIANSLANCLGSLFISLVPDPNSFYVTQVGWVNNIGSYTPGVQLYVSPTVAGALTITRPSTTGQVILPCLVPDSVSTGYFYTSSGTLIIPPTEFAWTTVTTNTSLSSNNGYFSNSSGNINFTLPTTFNEGDVIQIAGVSSGSWAVVQNAGQSIICGALGTTTIGAGGSLASTNSHDSIELIGYIANTTFYLKPPQGSITIV